MKKLWEAPQNILGYIMSRLWKKRLLTLSKRELEHLYGLEELTGFKIFVSDYYSHIEDQVLGKLSGFSMGKYICLNSSHDLDVLKHEKGHGKDSKIFGIFYLLIVGVYSSVFCNLWDRWFHADWNHYDRHYWYYKTRWTEIRADKFGNVKRNHILRRIERPEDSRYPMV